MTESFRATMRLLREHWLALVVFGVSSVFWVAKVERDHQAMITLLCRDHQQDSLCGGRS